MFRIVRREILPGKADIALFQHMLLCWKVMLLIYKIQLLIENNIIYNVIYFDLRRLLHESFWNIKCVTLRISD